MMSARLAPTVMKTGQVIFTHQRKESAVLILSRKKSESIMIGDHIRVTITEIRGDKVRIGVEAPKHIIVHRHEVHEAIQRHNAATDTDHD
jgi:carbon storage regulator